MEERGTREGSQEKPPPFAFRGCVAPETPETWPSWRDAWTGGCILTTFLFCFCVASPVCVWGGGECRAAEPSIYIFLYFLDSGGGSRRRGELLFPASSSLGLAA